MQLITTQAGGVTLAANRKREFSFAPPRVSHRDGFPIKNAERVFFIARADQKVFAANVTSGLRTVAIALDLGIHPRRDTTPRAMAPWKRGAVGPAGGASAADAPAAPPARARSWRANAWRRAGALVVSANERDRPTDRDRDGSSFASVVRRARRESSSRTAKRLKHRTATKQRDARVASNSRTVVLSSGYIYFLVLESSWAFTFALAFSGAFYTLVPILRPRRRGERRSLRTSPGASFRPPHAFNPRPRCL
eukprot:30789-Pelagococcus_subviridis.AAC.4